MYNPGIKIGGKHVFTETLYLNGVTTIRDFLNENGIIYCQEQILWKGFHLFHIPPMQYKSIISAISKCMSFFLIDRSSLKGVHLCHIILSLYY